MRPCSHLLHLILAVSAIGATVGGSQRKYSSHLSWPEFVSSIADLKAIWLARVLGKCTSVCITLPVCLRDIVCICETCADCVIVCADILICLCVCLCACMRTCVCLCVCFVQGLSANVFSSLHQLVCWGLEKHRRLTSAVSVWTDRDD